MSTTVSIRTKLGTAYVSSPQGGLTKDKTKAHVFKDPTSAFEASKQAIKDSCELAMRYNSVAPISPLAPNEIVVHEMRVVFERVSRPVIVKDV